MKIAHYHCYFSTIYFCAEALGELSWSAYSTGMHKADFWCTSPSEIYVYFRHSTYKCRM